MLVVFAGLYKYESMDHSFLPLFFWVVTGDGILARLLGMALACSPRASKRLEGSREGKLCDFRRGSGII
jgi:hypothetical protein